jgi:kynurenine formamidase
MYNGRPISDVTAFGARSNSVEHWRDGIVTRGVLYDIPRLRGTDHVTLDTPVHGWDLEDAAKAQGVEPRAGDATLVRSGAGPFFEANPEFQMELPPNYPGLHASALEYLYEHDASLLGWDLLDAANQGYPSPVRFAGRPMSVPIHEVAIPYMGMPLLDNCNLEQIAEVCAALGRWEFQLVVAPLIVVGGTGSPVNPIAVF